MISNLRLHFATKLSNGTRYLISHILLSEHVEIYATSKYELNRDRSQRSLYVNFGSPTLSDTEHY